MGQQGWRYTEVLAWTSADGPGRAPSVAPRLVTASVAAALTVTLSGILATDALCPDHRAWVQSLASVAIFSAVVAVAQVVRSQASASLFAMVAGVLGVVIGAIDAAHAPGRGALVALGFAVAGVGGAIVAFRLEHSARWGRELSVAHLDTEPVVEPAEAEPLVAASMADPAAGEPVVVESVTAVAAVARRSADAPR